MGAAEAQTGGDAKRQWLALGDSYSSGEGISNARDQPGLDQCQRSPTAYPRVAAENVKSTPPFDTVRLLACTGATVRRAKDGPDESVRDKDAARQLAELRPSDKYDVITMTFGGNDVGFSTVIKFCLGYLVPSYAAQVQLASSPPPTNLIDPVSCINESAARPFIRGLKTELTQLYVRASDHLRPGGHVYVLGYQHLFAPSNTWPLWVRATACSGVRAASADTFYRLVDEMNQTIISAIGEAGESVNYVPIDGLYRNHEVCGTEADWMNSFPTTDANEPNRPLLDRFNGSLHPNDLGHVETGKALAKTVQGRLAPWPPPTLSASPTTSPPPTPPPTTARPDRRSILSYDEMRGGAPYHGYFDTAFQSFVARSNTITQIGVTVGTPARTSGAAAPERVHIRLCSDSNCSTTLADGQASILNYGESSVDIDVAVTIGSTYFLRWDQPRSVNGQTWVTFWWAGGSSIAASERMQAVVRGYNR